MNISELWLPGLQAIALLIPVSLGLAATLSRAAAPFKSATVASTSAWAMALLLVMGLCAQCVVPELGNLAHGSPYVRVDSITGAMLLLVCTLGWVIVRYSRTYLDGDPGQLRYARGLLLTLASVSILVIANHLVMIAIAWTLTSVALHKLLTFYSDRPAALMAAHKKFLVSRLADLCLWSALVLLHGTVGLNLDSIAAWVKTGAELPATAQFAAVLCAVAAALKSAQLPFHGWLTQVMEAPTPVSALLHAGVVNLGGFLLIRLAPLMAAAPAAQWLLIGVGMTTTVIAALVTTTRVSVKVALAWSTCAQMGFMLVECGLGAWHLAFLHLLAHSLYKAHAFLSAGSAVEAWRAHAIMTPSPRPSSWRIAVGTLGAVVVAGLGVALNVRLGSPAPTLDASGPVLACLVALSVVPIMVQRRGSLATAVLPALQVALFYIAGHWLAARFFGVSVNDTGSVARWMVVLMGFALLYTIQSVVQQRPNGLFAHKLHTWLFAGLYLDERFTRLTFRLWPPRLQTSASSSHLIIVTNPEN